MKNRKKKNNPLQKTSTDLAKQMTLETNERRKTFKHPVTFLFFNFFFFKLFFLFYFELCEVKENSERVRTHGISDVSIGKISTP